LDEKKPMRSTVNDARGGPGVPAFRSVLRVGLRLVVLGALWLLLTGGDTGNLWLGAPFVAGGALLGGLLDAPGSRRPRLAAVLRFVPYFVSRSLAGGVDVSRRAMAPSMPVELDLISYETRLRSQSARVVFASTISLLPGTLSARLDGGKLQIHVVSGAESARRDLERLEYQVGRLFGEEEPRAERGERGG
jgi:multicomponent Na+:H+ antiporter subunit E